MDLSGIWVIYPYHGVSLGLIYERVCTVKSIVLKCEKGNAQKCERGNARNLSNKVSDMNTLVDSL